MNENNIIGKKEVERLGFLVAAILEIDEGSSINWNSVHFYKEWQNIDDMEHRLEWATGNKGQYLTTRLEKLLQTLRYESMEQQIRNLRNEVDCRIEHGASHGGHLNYVRKVLGIILRSVDD